MIRIPWWIWVGGIDVVLTAATATAHPYASPINLAGENNAAVWWTGAILFLAALHAFSTASNSGGQARRGWLCFGATMVLLQATEIGGLHERISGALDLRIGGQAILGLTAAALLTAGYLGLRRDPRWRGSVALIVTGTLTYGTVIVHEWAEWAYTWPHWTIGPRAAAEEGTELVGALLFLAAAMRGGGHAWSAPLSALFPPLQQTMPLRRLALPLFVPAILVSAYAADQSLIHSANPAACYPVMLYLLAACMALRIATTDPSQRRSHLLLGAVLLLLSVDSMATYWFNLAVYYPAPHAPHSLDVWASHLSRSSIVHVLLVLAWVMPRARGHRPRTLFAFVLVVAAAAAGMLLQNKFLQVASGSMAALFTIAALEWSHAWTRPVIVLPAPATPPRGMRGSAAVAAARPESDVQCAPEGTIPTPGPAILPRK